MNDDEVEKIVLYYMIFENEQCELTEKDFFNPIHKKIIKALNTLRDKKQEISLIAIREYAKIEDENMLHYLSNLGQYIYNMSFENAYIKLKNYTKKRQLEQVAKLIQNDIEGMAEVDNFIEKIIEKLQKIELQTDKDESFSVQLSNTLNFIENQIRKKEKDYSLHTGFFDLDNLTDGLHNGELTVVGARPRSRKNNICTSDSREYSKKRKKYCFCKFRDVRYTIDYKNDF